MNKYAESYFKCLMENSYSEQQQLFDKVKTAINSSDIWIECFEWLPMIESNVTIKKILINSKTEFQVSVECATLMTANCPTLERAVEFLTIYQNLIMDMTPYVGWPTWATRNKSEP